MPNPNEANPKKRPESGSQTAPSKGPAEKNAQSNRESTAGYRETVESILVAFILAFLFRTFVAEMFVIPTGSMAPTLMGAHKDTVCDHCGALYQSTASYEFDQSTQQVTDRVAIASTCAECRGVNAFDLAGDGNHATFSGDRIVVSKFDYLFSPPQRWDVLVFKYPEDARLNYIKRLVGLPGEQLHIEEGDVFVRTADNEPWKIARKPPHKVQAMLQIVSDTDHLPKDIVSKGWPSLWQPLPETATSPKNPWQVSQTNGPWQASLPAGANATQTQWLRYYHKYLDEGLWDAAAQGNSLPSPDPVSSTLITDFLAYNTTQFGPRQTIYPQGQLREGITSENRARDIVSPAQIRFDGLTGLPQDGIHWVGDLAAQFDIVVKKPEGTISLDLVEFGIHFRCHFDLASGKASLQAMDGEQPLSIFQNERGEAVSPTASSGVSGAGSYRLKIANVDDQLFVWVNGSLLKFDQPTTFDSQTFRSGRARRPYWTPTDPLDAAPIGIGGAGVELQVSRAQVWRDIYYIAIRNGGHFSDFSDTDIMSIIDSIPDVEIRDMIKADVYLQKHSLIGGAPALSWWYAHPELWSKSDLFARRGKLEFMLGADEFFPMGDNSAASSDARAWMGHNYVERRFLIGKALLVFFPHLWMEPVPHPNFPRMGLIR